MKEGDVVIVAMPQANGTIKNRPTIALREMPSFQDMLVCGVSTQLHHARANVDEAKVKRRERTGLRDGISNQRPGRIVESF